MNLAELFSCPKCKGELDRKYVSYTCKKCNVQYPIKNDIPIFMTGELESDNYSEFWNKGWGNRYEQDEHNFHQESNDEFAKQVMEKLNRSIVLKTPITSTMPIGHKIILNIGCGLDEASLFAGMGADNYIGLDYSYNAAQYSAQRISKLGRAGITAQANAELLPIKSQSIDLVYSSGVLHHTPNTEDALKEVFRVLKPNGIAVIGLYSTYSPTFVVARIVNSIKSIFARNGKRWFQLTETAWMTDGEFNPWTKTYSKRELKKIFSSLGCSSFNIRSTGFLWGNVIPVFGKYISETKLGELSARFFSSRLGSMWVITAVKHEMS